MCPSLWPSVPFLELLPALTYEFLFCHFLATWTPNLTLSWALLVQRPAIHLLHPRAFGDLTILGSTGSPPDSARGPWALVLVQPQLSSVQGLPLNMFEPGPRGFQIWRNSAATDSVLERAYDTLL